MTAFRLGFMSLFLAVMRRIRTRLKVFACRDILKYGRDLHLGERTRIWAPSSVVLGDNVYIGKDVHIEANCRIGNYCLLANRVAIVGRHDHDFTAVGFPVRFSPWVGSRRYPSPYLEEEAVIEDDVWLGYAAIVLTGTRICRGSIVAAGSIVTRDIPEYSIAAGVPAKVIGQRFPDLETIRKHESALQGGHFRFSERGYDDCLILPGLSKNIGK